MLSDYKPIYSPIEPLYFRNIRYFQQFDIQSTSFQKYSIQKHFALNNNSNLE